MQISDRDVEILQPLGEGASATVSSSKLHDKVPAMQTCISGPFRNAAHASCTNLFNAG